MDRTEATAWVMSVSSGLRASQSKTLAALVTAALTIGRVSLAQIGRRLAGTSAKHGIKRCWRFTANSRVHVSDAMAGVIAYLFRGRHWKRKPVIVALDWVEVRSFHTLVLAAVLDGRAVPLLWSSYPEWVLHKSQNNLEEGLLRLLRTMLPPKVRVIVLADRGFGRTEMGRLCQELGFDYVIRIRPDVWVRTPGFQGKLLDYPVKRGICRVLNCLEYRKRHPIEQRVVVRWKSKLPKRRDECWFLMSNLSGSACQLSELYGRRMAIEEFFRDGKSRRNGFALRNTQIKHPARFDRLVLILVLIYILLVALGLVARLRFRPGAWCSSNRQHECSHFTIGRRMLDKLEVPLLLALATLTNALQNNSPNWG
jgi:DDE family transposase